MITIEIIKTIHLFCAIGIFGILIGQTALIWHIPECMRLSLRFDHALLVLLPVLLLTGAMLVYPFGFTWKTPWIDVALIVVPLIAVLQAVSIRIKRRTLLIVTTPPVVPKLCHLINMINIALFIVLIHDAVTKSPL